MQAHSLNKAPSKEAAKQDPANEPANGCPNVPIRPNPWLIHVSRLADKLVAQKEVWYAESKRRVRWMGERDPWGRASHIIEPAIYRTAQCVEAIQSCLCLCYCYCYCCSCYCCRSLCVGGCGWLCVGGGSGS